MHNLERKSLIQFVSLFVSLITIFLLMVSALYYYYQKNLFIEAKRESMFYYTQKVYEYIYDATDLDDAELRIIHDTRFDVALITDKKTILLAPSHGFKVPLKEGFFEYKGRYYFIQAIEMAHLKSVEYIVVAADSIEEKLEKTRYAIYGFLLFSILFMSAVVYVLSKLFLRPLRLYIAKLDQFIRDTTHELNTPISVITMSIERIDMNTLDAAGRKNILRIMTAAKALSHLYHDLTFLMFYNSTESKNVPLDLHRLFEERIDYFRPLAEAKKISLAVDLKPSELVMDGDKMVRMVDNLLSNAIKYNKPGGEIGIELRESFFVIRDTGIGIAQQKLGEIFNRYSRFDETNGGFGIGLNLVDMICREYGLVITVTSTLGEGSIFEVKWNNGENSSH